MTEGKYDRLNIMIQKLLTDKSTDSIDSDGNNDGDRGNYSCL